VDSRIFVLGLLLVNLGLLPPASVGIRAGFARFLADDDPREKFTTTNLNDAGRRVSIKESFVEEEHAKGFALEQPHQSKKK
jgi:hypothetical protein